MYEHHLSNFIKQTHAIINKKINLATQSLTTILKNPVLGSIKI